MDVSKKAKPDFIDIQIRLAKGMRMRMRPSLMSFKKAVVRVN